MSKKQKELSGWEKFRAWVNGELEPQDQTLFIMEQKQIRYRLFPTDAEHAQREKHRMHAFLHGYPVVAAAICITLVAVLLATVLHMPTFGQADNPINNEVSTRYVEQGEAETGAANAVTGMILNYRGFDTLGESCVLFLAVVSVMILLLQDEKNTSPHEMQAQDHENAILDAHADVILQQDARLIIPCMILFSIYVLLNGEVSPGGGFSGGTILGAGLVLLSAAFGPKLAHSILNRKRYTFLRTLGLLLYAGLYGVYVFLGANALPYSMEGMTLLIDLAVGLVVACTIYGFYALFTRGEI